VPSVLSILRRGNTTYIVTQYVKGRVLSDMWSLLDEIQRESIISQLKVYIELMRSEKSPSKRICSVRGDKILDNRLYSNECGPFESYKEFNTMLLSGIDEVPRGYLDKNRKIVFTHGDLAPHNIIVRNGTIVSIIDWEFSGWFPEHWEY
ncbi:kinase-like protein, partial [Ramaria rubella]